LERHKPKTSFGGKVKKSKLGGKGTNPRAGRILFEERNESENRLGGMQWPLEQARRKDYKPTRRFRGKELIRV
jgi:hypothetical protein